MEPLCIDSQKQAFQEWLSRVNRLCLDKFQLGLTDLPDMLTRDAFDSGTTPKEFFEDVVMEVLREDFGSLVDEL